MIYSTILIYDVLIYNVVVNVVCIVTTELLRYVVIL